MVMPGFVRFVRLGMNNYIKVALAANHASFIPISLFLVSYHRLARMQLELLSVNF